MKKRLISTFERCVSFLDNHHLTWWVAFGTAIGTIRHKGMIPWDDDVDIFMPWPDYCCLLELSNEFEGTGLYLEKLGMDYSTCPYAKICDDSSTVWLNRNIHGVSGIWIDVFPLFRTNISEQEYWLVSRKYKRIAQLYSGSKRRFVVKDYVDNLLGLHFGNVFRLVRDITICKLFKQRFRKKLERYIESLDDKKGRMYFFPDMYDECQKNYFPISWFDETIIMPFEYFHVRIMKDYNQVLTQQYGDYMTPPPIESRYSTHEIQYINLSSKLSFSDVKRRVGMGIRFE